MKHCIQHLPISLQPIIIISIFIFGICFQGCSLTPKINDLLSGKQATFEAKNAYTTGTLSPDIQRVIILPTFHVSDQGPDLRLLDTIFTIELNKTLLFEVVPVARDQLKMLFGQEHFASVNSLPPTLFDTLKSSYGAQAVIFTDLTHYDPYRPIAIGLRCKLADLNTGNVLWAFDQIFDAGDPRVAQGAMHYFEQLNSNRYPLNRAESILQSPQRFSRFVAFATFQTLPRRPTRFVEVVNDRQEQLFPQ